MNKPCRVFSLLLILLSVGTTRAETPVSVQTEVSFLLGFVEGSGCEFYRNGTWYDSKTAQLHLREKYHYLVVGNLVSTTEQFIERAASESSLSGKPYEVRCKGGAPLASSRWLRDELARLRKY